MIRTRFAPSPTGYMHVGNLRTALFSYLLAKQNNGSFLLRIEDTDKSRQVENGIEIILKSLNWVGIMPDEGVMLDRAGKITQKGDFGPYIQSERLEIYKKYALELIEKNAAYYCFCTTERLDELRKKQELNKLAGGYDGYCLNHVTLEEAKKRVATGERHVVRLKMPKEGETVFTDIVHGEVRIKNALVDDQVLIKSDGFPTYHLAVVVDDNAMKITHVVRGDEWISSVPKHIQLYKYFGWELPQFAHLPLLLNTDKTKLSKRQGDVAVEDYKNKGYLPEAIINFVAFLGWNPGTDKEFYNLKELISDFSLDKVGKAGAVFNLEKLDWLNKEYLKLMPISELVTIAKPRLQPVILSAAKNPSVIGRDPSSARERTQDDKWLEKLVSLERDRITTLVELPEAVKFIFALPDYDQKILVWRKGTPEEVKKILPELQNFLESVGEGDWTKSGLESKIKAWVEDKKYSTGSVLWPLRVALSGQQNSPGPFEIAEVLGKTESLSRLSTALTKLG